MINFTQRKQKKQKNCFSGCIMKLMFLFLLWTLNHVRSDMCSHNKLVVSLIKEKIRITFLFTGHGKTAASASIPSKYQTIVSDNSERKGFLSRAKRFGDVNVVCVFKHNFYQKSVYTVDWMQFITLYMLQKISVTLITLSEVLLVWTCSKPQSLWKITF